MTVVRRARPEEWRALRALRLSALAGEPTAFWTTYEEAVARPDAWWQEWAGNEIWVAEAAEGGLVALASWFLDDGLPHVVAVWAEPEHRGSGTADALMSSVEAAIVADGHDRARLWVNDNNARARRFYERRGYTPTGRSIPMDPHPGQTDVEMTKRLR